LTTTKKVAVTAAMCNMMDLQ